MPDNLTPEQRKECMSHIRSINTKPELALRRALWHQGFRYRINDKRLPGKPDIVLTKYRTVIFIHGCFWHGHHGCQKFVIPKTNCEYWIAKIARNQERDQDVWRQLESRGWAVIIIWECEIKNNSIDETLLRVTSTLKHNEEKHLSTLNERRKLREAYLQQRRDKRERERVLKKEIIDRF